MSLKQLNNNVFACHTGVRVRLVGGGEGWINSVLA